jgi:hypothetical protein
MMKISVANCAATKWHFKSVEALVREHFNQKRSEAIRSVQRLVPHLPDRQLFA